MCLDTFMECLFHLISTQRPVDCVLAYCPSNQNHVFFLDDDSVVAAATDTRNCRRQAPCSCGATAVEHHRLSVVDSVTEFMTSHTVLSCSGGQSAHGHDNISSSADVADIGEKSTASLGKHDVLFTLEGERLWDTLTGTITMYQSSLDIAAAVLRVRTILQELS